MWGDGTVSDDVDGRLLAPISDQGRKSGAAAAGIPMLFLGDVVQHKYYPLLSAMKGPIVGPNASLDMKKLLNNDNYGIVLSVNDEEHFAKVQWLKVIHGKAIQVEDIEDCSLFDLSDSTEKFKISPGGLGILSKVEFSSRRNSLRDFLFIAGRHLPNGKRVAHFLDGNDGYLWPVEMLSISDFQSGYSGLAFSKAAIPSILKEDPLNLLTDQMMPTQNTEQSTKNEKESTQTVDLSGAQTMETCSDGVRKRKKSSERDSEKVSFKKAKIELLESSPFVGTAGQGFTKSINDDGISSTSASIDEHNLPITENGNATTHDSTMTIEPSIKKSFKKAAEDENAKKLSTFSSDSSFQMLPTCTAHKWLKVKSESFNAAFKHAVQKEYKMLAELPEGILVRAYEDRLDLLHAVIVGPRGTPFDSAPYFFEIKLPEEYPNKPPKVNFVPYSTEALNPNLYQEGKVCLSLLGTWAGRKSEKWNPNISNLHQVLLSIQALILNAEPYWNEPGREHSKKDPQQIIASQRYNETTTMSSIQYMERIFETPPPSFEGMIREIICVRLPDYRSRIESWFGENDSSSKPEYPLPRLSKGFQLTLSNALKRIQRAIDESSRNDVSEANGDEPIAL